MTYQIDCLNRLLKKDNRYFTIDKLKICFGSITVKEINKFEEFFLPITYEKSFNILATDSVSGSEIAAYSTSLNSFKLRASIKSQGISYLTIGYWLLNQKFYFYAYILNNVIVTSRGILCLTLLILNIGTTFPFSICHLLKIAKYIFSGDKGLFMPSNPAWI